MSRFTLKDVGLPYKKIIHKNKWIGRVLKHADGDWLAIIGKTSVRKPTEAAAFHEVVSRHCGFESAAAMDKRNQAVKAKNAVIRRENKARRAEVQSAFNQAVSGDYAPLMKILEKGFKVG